MRIVMNIFDTIKRERKKNNIKSSTPNAAHRGYFVAGTQLNQFAYCKSEES